VRRKLINQAKAKEALRSLDKLKEALRNRTNRGTLKEVLRNRTNRGTPKEVRRNQTVQINRDKPSKTTKTSQPESSLARTH
jgi:hypothetical protein